MKKKIETKSNLKTPDVNCDDTLYNLINLSATHIPLRKIKSGDIIIRNSKKYKVIRTSNEDNNIPDEYNMVVEDVETKKVFFSK